MSLKSPAGRVANARQNGNGKRGANGSAKFSGAHSIIYVLSDSTGNLARHMMAAFLTQFPPGVIDVRYETFIRTAEKLDAALRRIRETDGVVCHAMVTPTLKRRVARFCAAAGLPSCDLTGGVFDFLVRATGLRPGSDPEALHRVDHAYKRRINALEFTLGHDDGLGVENLVEADVVLAGVSRTSKTPTSIYLAQQGFRVANVSLAAGVEPPAEFLALPREKVVGLVIDPQQLVLIRARRQSGWRMGRTSYDDPGAVTKEVEWTRRLFVAKGWPVLDVTDQAVEETAAHVLRILGLTFKAVPEQHESDFS